MAVLTAAKRAKLPAKAFALPGGRYPIHDKIHARNALARVAQHGTPEEKKKVQSAVAKKFPDIGGDGQDNQILGFGPPGGHEGYGKGVPGTAKGGQDDRILGEGVGRAGGHVGYGTGVHGAALGKMEGGR